MASGGAGGKRPNPIKQYAAFSTTKQAMKKKPAPKGQKGPAKASEPFREPPVEPEPPVDPPGGLYDIPGPPVPAGQEAHLLLGFQGGIHFFNTTTHQTMAPEGDGWVCSTVQIASDRGKKKGKVQPKPPRCHGKWVPPIDHDPHHDSLSNSVLNELIYKLAINTLVALMAQEMLVGQVRQADNYLRQLILLEKVNKDTSHIKKFDKKWRAIVKRRNPFSEQNARFRVKQVPLMVHPVSDFGAAMELTIWIVWKRVRKIIPCITPEIDLGYHDLRDRPLPDRKKEYHRRLPVPGNQFLPFLKRRYDAGVFTRFLLFPLGNTIISQLSL